MFVGGPPAVIAAATRDRRPLDGQRELLARIDGGLADLTAAPPEGHVRVFRGMPGRLRRPYGPGWALVGDSGWWKDPLSTHGITAALHDAELLAAAVVAGAESEPAAELALACYQERRDQLALPMHPLVDRLASHEWDLVEARRLLRGLSALMATEVEAILGPDRAAARTA